MRPVGSAQDLYGTVMVEDRNVLRLPNLLDHKGGHQSSRSISDVYKRQAEETVPL